MKPACLTVGTFDNHQNHFYSVCIPSLTILSNHCNITSSLSDVGPYLECLVSMRTRKYCPLILYSIGSDGCGLGFLEIYASGWSFMVGKSPWIMGSGMINTLFATLFALVLLIIHYLNHLKSEWILPSPIICLYKV